MNNPDLEGLIKPQENLTAYLEAARTDKRVLNKMLHDYMPFIKKCLAGVFFKGQSKADNLSDAMLAFVHSVNSYNPEKGAFFQYAAAVIRNRLIDNARKEMLAEKRFLSFSADISMELYDQAEDERNLGLEIEAVNEEFAKWGFSWATLLKKCPKQERSRLLALRIARTVLQNPVLLAGTLKNRQLPISQLAESFNRKSIEKYRQYIAALIILSQGDYPYVYSFVPQPFNLSDIELNDMQEENT